MNTQLKSMTRLFAALFLAVSVSFAAGCDGILEVDDRAIVVPDDIDDAGPAGIPTLINGMVGVYHDAVDDIVRYTGLFTDEFVKAGTFPTRIQVDVRRILANNATLTEDMYVPLHQARLQADTTAFILESRLNDPDFEEAVDELNEGITFAKLYGGFSRLWLAEIYCWSILTGMAEETEPRLPDDRIREALVFLREAEQHAGEHGMEDARLAAIVGQARAHLWLGEYAEAQALAREVPRDFSYDAEYSNNDPDQFNQVYTFTHGDTEAIRWSVGDGTTAARGNEIFEHFDEFVGLNLIIERPDGYTSFNASIPVNLQTLYGRPETNIYMASGYEALLIDAEVLVRTGATAQAQAILNDLRSDFSTRATIRFGVNPPDPENELQPISLSGNLEADVKAVADERARELWLTGDRHLTARRLRLDPEVDIDLYPPIKTELNGGDDIAFPLVQRELDNNPNLSGGDACPSGDAGSWR